jgi:outer membrane protein TolC
VSTTSYERGAFERIQAGQPGEALARVHGPSHQRSRGKALDGSLEAYVAYAMAQNPGITAAYEEWRAATYAIEERRRLPDPMISAGVGMQRQRFGAQQMIPWPGKRSAMAAAASDMASAAERRLEDQALFIVKRVAEAYWRLWTIQQVRAIETEQRALLSALAEAARTRLTLGKTSLADVTQIDLEVARRDDALRGLDEREISARAMLRQVIGAPPDLDLPISAPTPLAVVPAEHADALARAARAHPRIRALVSMAQASDNAASAASAEGKPDFMIGIDYETELMPDATASGEHHVMVMVGMTVPLWRGTYGAAQNRARAEAAGFRARQREAENMAEAELEATLAEVRDAARRIALYETTLIPQAETAYVAVTGNYQTGAAQLASTLLAQQSVLELNNLLVQARADHARAWSRLEEIVGHPVAAQPLESRGDQ